MFAIVHVKHFVENVLNGSYREPKKCMKSKYMLVHDDNNFLALKERRSSISSYLMLLQDHCQVGSGDYPSFFNLSCQVINCSEDPFYPYFWNYYNWPWVKVAELCTNTTILFLHDFYCSWHISCQLPSMIWPLITIVDTLCYQPSASAAWLLNVQHRVSQKHYSWNNTWYRNVKWQSMWVGKPGKQFSIGSRTFLRKMNVFTAKNE
jgi:hypothetical protein